MNYGNLKTKIFLRIRFVFSTYPLLKPYYNNEIYKWKPNNTVDLYVRKYCIMCF